jgi:hypothetical protein
MIWTGFLQNGVLHETKQPKVDLIVDGRGDPAKGVEAGIEIRGSEGRIGAEAGKEMEDFVTK